MFQFPWYASSCLWIQHAGTRLLHRVGFPIRTSPDRCLLTAPRGHIVVRHVLHRLLAPRHPPCALANLSCARRFAFSVPSFSLRSAWPRIVRESRNVTRNQTGSRALVASD